LVAAIRPQGIDLFRVLAARGGWKISLVIERPSSDNVALTRA